MYSYDASFVFYSVLLSDVMGVTLQLFYFIYIFIHQNMIENTKQKEHQVLCFADLCVF